MAKEQKGAGKAGKNKKFKKRERKNVPFGLVHIQASFNNTIVTITDNQGNTLSWKSSGSLGFRGSRKGTPFAAQQAAVNAANAARDHGLRSVRIVDFEEDLAEMSGVSRQRLQNVKLDADACELTTLKDPGQPPGMVH